MAPRDRRAPPAAASGGKPKGMRRARERQRGGGTVSGAAAALPLGADGSGARRPHRAPRLRAPLLLAPAGGGGLLGAALRLRRRRLGLGRRLPGRALIGLRRFGLGPAAHAGLAPRLLQQPAGLLEQVVGFGQLGALAVEAQAHGGLPHLLHAVDRNEGHAL